MCINLLDIGVTMFVLFSNNEYFVARALARTGAATPASPADSPAEARAHWSVEMDESADQIFSKTLREFLKDT